MRSLTKGKFAVRQPRHTIIVTIITMSLTANVYYYAVTTTYMAMIVVVISRTQFNVTIVIIIVAFSKI